MSLNFTKNQTLILGILFNHPEKSYYLREIGRLVGKEPGVFQKDINKLVESGILTSEYRAKSRFFALNKLHPLYKEYKSIFFKTIGAEGQLKLILKNIENIKVAFIYGSFATGKEDAFSDIDLMIIGNPDEDVLIRKISLLERKIDREINYNIFSPTDIRNNLLNNEIFLKEIMERPKAFIIGDQNELEEIIGK
ncbi:nucleotidyltransferase domain-containing protein [Patescibacteria group bacterium]|nr:nucleotidyltransferase domain-containing protein [Patescibacteria group bacterium]MBU4162045.1 nucleotidyltransferase domain-containing protein [Patescibacteria group bacterium]